METVSIAKIEGTGDFPCPNCGAIISPEDDTGKVYTLLETQKTTEGSLKEIILLCKCGSKIRLIGFVLSSGE